MMNAIGLCLVVASLVSAGIWSPTKNDNNMIVKEGHRVVVVEYDQDDQPITKVSISPESHHFNSDSSSVSDKLPESSAEWRSPKELICDAYGRCKHRIAEAVGKTTDSAADTAHRVEDSYGRATEKVRRGASEVEDAVKEVRDLGKTIGVDVAKNVTCFTGRLWNEAVLLGRAVSGEALNPLSGTLYMLAFATAYGSGVWVTFVEGRVLATALPRSQFAVVQSRLFPVYFRTTVASVGAAAFWFVMVHRGQILESIPELVQLYNLLTSLILVLINSFFLEPRATKVMFERMRVEKEEGRSEEENPSSIGEEGEGVRKRIDELNGRLKKLNTWSSLLNLMCLMCLSWHLFYLGLRLHLTF